MFIVIVQKLNVINQLLVFILGEMCDISLHLLNDVPDFLHQVGVRNTSITNTCVREFVNCTIVHVDIIVNKYR